MSRHIPIIAIIVCVMALTGTTAAQHTTGTPALVTQTWQAAGQATALPADWNEATPITWLNAQVQTAEAPVVLSVEPPADASDMPVQDVFDEDAYIATLERLVNLVERLAGFIPLGSFASVLIVVIGIGWIIVRLTPTKRDDELFERVVKAVVDRITNAGG